MNKKDRYNQIEKIKGGLSLKDSLKIDQFFNDLEKNVNLSLYGNRLLFSHYIKAFEYYLEKNKSIDEIIKLIDIKNLGDFYSNNKRQFYKLDSAGIVYPLSMRYGQMFMYRVSANLKEDVVPEILQMALDFTIKRFPSFSTVVKSGFFWHYLETVNNVPYIEEENDVPCKPMSIFLRSYRSYRILYYKKRISLEIFHALSDGTGSLVFLKTLLREYFVLLGKDVSTLDDVFDINSEVKQEELVNEFAKAKGKSNLDTFIDKKAIQVDGRFTRVNPYKIIHFEINSKKLKTISKKYNCTITAYILALLFIAIKQATSKSQGIVNIQVPVNMRKFNNSKTLRNCSMYFNATLNLNEISDVATITENINKQLLEKGTYENMNKMMITSNKLIKVLNYIPLIIKMPIFQLIYGYFSNSIITTSLSNLGIINMPEEIKDDIDDFSLVFPSFKPNRFTCGITTYNNSTIITITKANKLDIIENSIYDSLLADGLKVEVKASIEYES